MNSRPSIHHPLQREMANELQGDISQVSRDFETLEIGAPLVPDHPALNQGDPILTAIQELQSKVTDLQEDIQSRYVSPPPIHMAIGLMVWLVLCIWK